MFRLYDEVDKIKGLKNKKAFMKRNAPSRGKNARHSTFVCNYSGFADWGEVADYIEDYEIVVDGHLVFEIAALSDRIILSMMQLFQSKKYASSLEEVFKELRIPYDVKCPFPKHIPKHRLPKA